jgi:hypothetical protein
VPAPQGVIEKSPFAGFFYGKIKPLARPIPRLFFVE